MPCYAPVWRLNQPGASEHSSTPHAPPACAWKQTQCEVENTAIRSRENQLRISNTERTVQQPGPIAIPHLFHHNTKRHGTSASAGEISSGILPPAEKQTESEVFSARLFSCFAVTDFARCEKHTQVSRSLSLLFPFRVLGHTSDCSEDKWRPSLVGKLKKCCNYHEKRTKHVEDLLACVIEDVLGFFFSLRENSSFP
ncbi:hypothetical protein BaRGS_00016916 [Batillaria attramentaria]|uniref:Uncharacterized protein n=1 Tax=Batillaria attramentaria TaxID=370345 RepID=A0ABD0KXF5_9CAEN